MASYCIIMTMTRTVQKKICLLGDFAVGKTSLVRRFVYQRFEEKYQSTIGVNISRKELQLNQHERLQMVIWDLAGGEEFSGPQANYIKGASGAMLVCDLTRAITLSTLRLYAANLQAASPGAALVIVANKSDLVAQRVLAEAQLAELAAELQAPLFMTSAKNDENVEAAFATLASIIA